MEPVVRVQSDYDGYFASMVRGWISVKQEPFKHEEVVISAGPWRSSAVSFESNGKTLHLDFYSALRNGFGSLSSEDRLELIKIL